MSSRIAPLVVVADDDPDILRMMEYHLRSWSFRAIGVTGRDALFDQLARELPVVLLLDLRLGTTDGLVVLEEVRAKYAGLPIIMLTAHGSIDTAVTAMKRGAYDYLTKPPDLRRMRLVIEHAVERQGIATHERPLKPSTAASEMEDDDRLWGTSQAMKRVKSIIASVAPTDATVLILGETGTGKELVARAVHDQSRRRRGPFIPVNVAALPRDLAESVLFGHEKGAFTGAQQMRQGFCEAAGGGTLFLDEMGEMDLQLQSKLLRFLQERAIVRVGASVATPVDVRIVAATNRDLPQQVREGKFREDLYFRLNVVPIELPPLRERGDDILILARRFLASFARRYDKPAVDFTPAALDRMLRFAWPGNIRQLENLMERLVIFSGGVPLDVADLPAEMREPGSGIATAAMPAPLESSAAAPPVPEPTATSANTAGTGPETDPNLRRMDAIERQAICDSLRQASGNVRAAARALGVSPATMYRKFKQYDIRVDDELDRA